jgi:glycosyltransferase involved in cell wall biosynthesis
VSWFKKVVFEMHDFPELMSLRGHQANFLDYDEGDSKLRFTTTRMTGSRAHHGSQVFVTTPPRIFPGIVGRLLAVILQPVEFFRMVRIVNPDIVVSYSVPTSGWQIMGICRLKKIPFVLRLIDVPHALRPTRFRPLVKWSERLLYRYANHITTHNEVLRQYCIAMGALKEKTSVILPGIDTKRFCPEDPDLELRDRLGIGAGSRVIVFMGTLFRFSGLVELINEYSKLMATEQSVVFLVIGDGEDFDRVQKTVRDRDLQGRVFFTGKIDYEQLADYLRLGHVAVLPFQPELISHGALPAKVLQYLACGLPTAATPLMGLKSVIPDGQGVAYGSDICEVAQISFTLAKDDLYRDSMRLRGLQFLNRECNWDNQIDRFEDLLEELTGVK